MELTVNLFSKGLQIDTHPMVLDNNTLSDALNATFVTMNGNEVILQNDMGNRRIDNAFLPAGYQPLGMKEYGGVIYIAAYNPLTNRGLIGSFPSPLRKVNIDKDLEGRLDFNNFIDSDYIDSNNRKYGYIRLEYIIVPISDKIVLHTGDKFSIYSSQISEFLLYLLPNNEDSRKNNLFTFLVGVFNSLNEFVDITDKLKIWDNGYFINTELGIPNETISDNELLKARNRMAINTYSQKMSSPLYLKATINHISSLSCSIVEAEFINNAEAKLTIEVTYLYNCIDNINGQTFKMLFNDKEATIEEDNDPIYLEEFNQYSKTIIYNVIIRDFTEKQRIGEDRYNYELKFPLLNNFEEWNYPIYIKSLNRTDSIDLSKIGSDTIIFRGYRYFNNTSTKMTTLVVNLESYPKKGSDLCVEIKAIDMNPSSSLNGIIKNIGKIERPGVGTFTIPFSYNTFGDRRVFLLNFIKELGGIKESLNVKDKNYLYITTGIFNGNYLGKKFLSEDLKKEFYYNEIFNYSYDYIKDVYIEDFSIILKLDLTPVLKYFISKDTSESTLHVEGNYIFPVSHSNNTESYKIEEQWDIISTLDLHVEVSNFEVYPEEVDHILGIGLTNGKKLSIKDNSIKRSINDNTIFKDETTLKYYYGDADLYELSHMELDLKKNLLNKEDDEHIITISELYETTYSAIDLLKIKLRSTVKVGNILKGRLVEKTIFCERIITSFWNFVKKHYYSNSSQIDDPSKANSSILLIKNPYFCFDFEGSDYLSMTYTNKLAVVKDLKDDRGEEEPEKVNGRKSDGSYIEEIARDCMSDKLNDKSQGNLFVIEMSSDDYICGFYPCVLDDREKYSATGNEYSGILRPAIIRPRRSFRRIWMKINKSEYIPLFVTINRNPNNGNLLEDSNEIVDYMYLDKGFHNLLLHIPHYYEYETEGKTLLEKVFNITNYSRTKEFEVDSNIKLIIEGKAILLVNTDKSIYSLNRPEILEEISFTEGIIHSNLDFEEDIYNINNYTLPCGIMEGDYDNNRLYIKDSFGKKLDPLYVYYDDSECKNGFSEKSFKPSYIAEKFYVPELDSYVPELKSSRKLYSGKNGEHDLISEYVYPFKKLRNLLILGIYSNYNTTIYNDYDENRWDKTLIQREGGDGYDAILVPLRTLNIFDRTYITKYCLVQQEDLNGSNPMSEWIDYDDHINLLNL